ncbi:ABC transporter ATP-binding protein, partial [Campylobacter jejuni]|uniref:ABC transporter ATP-binding protein n=1 Tax=Campylobacter jejuni TaxID=197 RepID=UPI001ADFBEBB
FYFTRSTVYRLSNRFYARNMEKMVNAAFQRVQSFSSDWHANTFAGATVRRVSRSMWGYDQVSDAVLLMLMPTLIVLTGLVVSMGLHWVW